MKNAVLLALILVLGLSQTLLADELLGVERQDRKWYLVYREGSAPQVSASELPARDEEQGILLGENITLTTGYMSPRETAEAVLDYLARSNRVKTYWVRTQLNEIMTQRLGQLGNRERLTIQEVQVLLDQSFSRALPSARQCLVNGCLLGGVVGVNVGSYYLGSWLPPYLASTTSVLSFGVSFGLGYRWTATLQSWVSQLAMGASESTAPSTSQTSHRQLQESFSVLFSALDQLWGSGYAHFGMNREMARNILVDALGFLTFTLMDCRYYLNAPSTSAVPMTAPRCLATRVELFKPYFYDIIRLADVWRLTLSNRYLRESFQYMAWTYEANHPGAKFSDAFLKDVREIDSDSHLFEEDYYGPMIQMWLSPPRSEG